MSKTRTERLLALVLVLLSTRRPLSRSEIKAAVQEYPKDANAAAFERMFERDKDELRAMGIPIDAVESDSVEGVGYRLASSRAFLDAIELDPAERVVLALASRMWQEATWGHDALNALRKLELAGEFSSDGAATGFAMSLNVDSIALTQLLDATSTRQRVTFDYRKSGEPTAEARLVEPWGIVAARGHWYAVGHDVRRDDTRAFRISRISGQIKLKKPAGAFEIPTRINLHELVTASFPSGELVDVEVRLAPGRAARLRELASDSDGETATLRATDPISVLPELLRAGDAIEVLSPDSTRESVRSALAAITSASPTELSDADRNALQRAKDSAARVPTETAHAQVSRLLALVPWLQANPGVTFAEAAGHFGVTKEQLNKDLRLAVCTEFGANFVTLEIEMWTDRITVRDARGMEAPLSLTRSEATSLLIGLRLLAQIPGPHDHEALARVENKIEQAAGDAAELVSHVSVSERTPAGDNVPSAAVSDAVAESIRASRALKIRYRSVSRDEVSERTVDPIGVLSTGGSSYVEAWCRTAVAVRLFRIDRIQSAHVLDEPSSVPADIGEPTREVDPIGAEAIFELDPAIAWWADQVPAQGTVTRADGSALVALRIASEPWAVRTALGFGGQLRVIEPAELASKVGDAAKAALQGYRGRP